MPRNNPYAYTGSLRSVVYQKWGIIIIIPMELNKRSTIMIR